MGLEASDLVTGYTEGSLTEELLQVNAMQLIAIKRYVKRLIDGENDEDIKKMRAATDQPQQASEPPPPSHTPTNAVQPATPPVTIVAADQWDRKLQARIEQHNNEHNTEEAAIIEERDGKCVIICTLCAASTTNRPTTIKNDVGVESFLKQHIINSKIHEDNMVAAGIEYPYAPLHAKASGKAAAPPGPADGADCCKLMSSEIQKAVEFDKAFKEGAEVKMKVLQTHNQRSCNTRTVELIHALI